MRNIGALPKHLPRCEEVIEPETTVCPCCSGALHRIGAETREALDVIPASVRVKSMHPASAALLGLGWGEIDTGLCWRDPYRAYVGTKAFSHTVVASMR